MLGHFESLHDAEALVVQLEPFFILQGVEIAESEVVESSRDLEVRLAKDLAINAKCLLVQSNSFLMILLLPLQ